jgi:hypothetical protein
MFIPIKEDVTVACSSITLTGDIHHSATQHALTLIDPSEPAEILSTNFSGYGLIAQEDTVFIKDWSEHQGVTASLVEAGVVEIVRMVHVGPFRSRAYEVRVLGAAPAAALAMTMAVAA